MRKPLAGFFALSTLIAFPQVIAAISALLLLVVMLGVAGLAFIKPPSSVRVDG